LTIGLGKSMTTAALIVAAGRGSRAGNDAGLPKQYARLGRKPMLAHVVGRFVSHPDVDAISVVIHPDDAPHYSAATEGVTHRLQTPVRGGETRQASVRLGLEALAGAAPDQVLIHDAARPFVSHDVISRVIDALGTYAGAIAAEPLVDTLKRASATGTIAGTVDRDGLWRAQTPQGFRFAPILEAHRRAAGEGREDFTDDASLAEWAGIEVALVRGSSRNMKITHAEDLAMAEKLLTADSGSLEPRIGTGFDVHRFGPGDHVWLGGVRIAHTQGLVGHSDADVALHALTDALLGAIGDGDIGAHFPPSDPKWKGAASRLFVEDAAARVAALGGRISNVDITLLCEAPRIGPHRDAMRASISRMLAIDVSRVGVKATTTEGLGFTGRGEGLAAMASATVLLPVAGA
jgi:2-C-methyl-D-erythritol 4-phosphate cytidylyltransferase / 2-C-methyl-D-erythritol 2,4-cyclodiphosphate synthase